MPTPPISHQSTVSLFFPPLHLTQKLQKIITKICLEFFLIFFTTNQLFWPIKRMSTKGVGGKAIDEKCTKSYKIVAKSCLYLRDPIFLFLIKIFLQRKVTQASERDLKYQTIMRNLVRRYVTQVGQR